MAAEGEGSPGISATSRLRPAAGHAVHNGVIPKSLSQQTSGVCRSDKITHELGI